MINQSNTISGKDLRNVGVLQSGKYVNESHSIVMETSQERKVKGQIKKLLEKYKGSKAVNRFAEKYAKIETKRAYLIAVDYYFRWLKTEKKIEMTPDELIKDNLVCVYKSEAIDIETKRKHTDLLSEYINNYTLNLGWKQSARALYSAAVVTFYKKNDSELFGDYKVSEPADLSPPPPPLPMQDVRTVLKAMDIEFRTPFVCMLQSGSERSRIMRLRWGHVLEGLNARRYTPLKLSFQGRKNMRKPFFTYLGRDAQDALRMWKAKWTELHQFAPNENDFIFSIKPNSKATISEDYLNIQFKSTAAKLFSQGLISVGNPKSWTTHKMRHVFKTEASHSGAERGIVEFFGGHRGGIEWVYDHPSIHEEDYVKEYLKIEPFISLDYNETIAKDELNKKEKEFQSIFLDYQKSTSEIMDQKMGETKMEILGTLLGTSAIEKPSEEISKMAHDKLGKLTTDDKLELFRAIAQSMKKMGKGPESVKNLWGEISNILDTEHKEDVEFVNNLQKIKDSKKIH